MTDELQKLFGPPARVKLLRLFLFNPRSAYTLPDAAKRARVPDEEAHREIALFARIGLVERTKRAPVRWGLNTHFEYVAALQNLLLNAPARSRDIVARIRAAGAFKLVILSGIFVGEWEGRLDLFLVGDRIKERKLRECIRALEAEIGKEVRYALLLSEDFLYRLNMNDKLVRDVLDYSHRIVLDRLGTGLK
ncbi:MAG: hypothetical protein Q7S26_00600 [bacterium]|nr:hypothetical protein [bacterium]